MTSLPPLPRVVAINRRRAIPVDPADLRLLYKMLVLNIGLGLINLAATAWEIIHG
jgi:hypothetical protein